MPVSVFEQLVGLVIFSKVPVVLLVASPTLVVFEVQEGNPQVEGLSSLWKVKDHQKQDPADWVPVSIESLENKLLTFRMLLDCSLHLA